MATKAASALPNGVAKQPNGVPVKKPAGAKAPVKKGPVAKTQQRATPVAKKAQSVAAGESAGGVTSPYAIMAQRIANRVAEMAETYTFVERPKQPPSEPQRMESIEEEIKKKPRKLEMRLGASSKDSVAFSAPFLDNTLQKMLQLQNRMLKTTADLSKADGVEESVIKEHASQSAELSRIIAMICAEKARQGA